MPLTMPPPPRSDCRSSAEPERVLSRYARSRQRRDFEHLVVRYRPLAMRLAHRYAGRSYGREDLEQVACIGLIKAIQRFDPSRGCAFTTFAIPTILGELRRYCRDTGWSAHVPRGMQERIAAVRIASDVAAASLRRTPTAADVARELGWSDEDVLEALVAGSTRATVPLEGDSDESADTYSLMERLGETDPRFELVECLSALEASMPALSPAEKRVLRLRFGEDLGLQEIARRLDIPDGQVSRLLTSAIATLRVTVGLACDEPPASERRLTSGRRPGTPSSKTRAFNRVPVAS